MNTKPEVTNYRRTLSRKVVTVTGVANEDEAIAVAFAHTGETMSSLFNVYVEFIPSGTFVVNLCTD